MGRVRAVIASLILGGAFGTASAEVVSLDGDVMVVDIEVELAGSAQAVVAHLSFDNDPALTLPLLDRGGGVFGVMTELEAKNYVVVFEALGDPSTTSQAVTLSELGAVIESDSPSGSTTTTTTGPATEENQQLLWLAIAAAAASLSLLAFWVLGGDDPKGEELAEDSPVSQAGEEE